MQDFLHRHKMSFLLLRIEAEISAKNNIEEYMVEAARKIVAISNRYNIPPRLFRFSANEKLEEEVNEVIRELKENIQYTTETLSVYNREEDRDSILAWMNGKRYGRKLRDWREKPGG